MLLYPVDVRFTQLVRVGGFPDTKPVYARFYGIALTCGIKRRRAIARAELK